MVYNAGTAAGQDAATDPKVADFLGVVCDLLRPHTTAAWSEHSPLVVAAMEACPPPVPFLLARPRPSRPTPSSRTILPRRALAP
jgi:hypothetical protein